PEALVVGLVERFEIVQRRLSLLVHHPLALLTVPCPGPALAAARAAKNCPAACPIAKALVLWLVDRFQILQCCFAPLLLPPLPLPPVRFLVPGPAAAPGPATFPPRGSSALPEALVVGLVDRFQIVQWCFALLVHHPLPLLTVPRRARSQPLLVPPKTV